MCQLLITIFANSQFVSQSILSGAKAYLENWVNTMAAAALGPHARRRIILGRGFD